MQLLHNILASFTATESVAILDQTSPEQVTIALAPEVEVRYFGVVGFKQHRKRVRFVLQDGARLRCVTVVCGSGHDRLAVDYVIEHVGRGSTASTLVKGVFADSAHAEVFGLIKILPSGQQAESFLEQRALLLSDTAFANVQPKLQIEANDLKAGHAATVGQLDETQLFYCQSRGLPRAAAARLWAAVAAPLYEGIAAPAAGERLARLQAELILLYEGLEAFRAPEQVQAQVVHGMRLATERDLHALRARGGERDQLVDREVPFLQDAEDLPPDGSGGSDDRDPHDPTIVPAADR